MASTDNLTKDQASALVRAIEDVPGVDSMHPGKFNEAFLLFSDGRIFGLDNTRGKLKVHITVDLDAVDNQGTTLIALSDAIRRVVASTSKDAIVDVVIADATYSPRSLS